MFSVFALFWQDCMYGVKGMWLKGQGQGGYGVCDRKGTVFESSVLKHLSWREEIVACIVCRCRWHFSFKIYQLSLLMCQIGG